MRNNRTHLLSQNGGFVHKFWRAHNKSFLLHNHADKESYLKETFFATSHKSVNGEVGIHAYCIMSNHSHQIVSYKEKSESLSKFMRIAHSKFGQKYNKIHSRQGAVAYDRPKTPQIQSDDFHQMRVHFYIEANPLRAKMVKNLRAYTYSSFRFYAWGISDKFSKFLSIPHWYIKLGKNPKQRQAKYRSLFNKYLGEILERNILFTKSKFIGDILWTLQREELFKIHSIKHSILQNTKPPPF